MRGAVLVACLLAVTAMTAGCVEIQNPPAAQGTAPAPTVILIERDGSVTTLSQAPGMPGPDSDAARAVGAGNNASTTTSSSSSSSTTTAPAADNGTTVNTPPEITGFSASTAVGKAPLNVTFRFGARDVDGQALNYTLHFGDGSSPKSGMLPTTKDPFHIYTGVGAKKAILFVGDGNNVTNSSVSINVEAAVAPFTPLHYSEETMAPCTGCDLGSASCLGLLMRESGFDCAFFDLPATAAGRSFVAWTDSDFALSFGVWFRDDCDPFGLEPDFPNPFGALESEVRGTVPTGARCVVLYDTNTFPTGFPSVGSTLSIDIL